MNTETSTNIIPGAQFVSEGSDMAIITIEQVFPYYLGTEAAAGQPGYRSDRANWRTVKSGGRFYNVTPSMILN